jgi:hypothetical protein
MISHLSESTKRGVDVAIWATAGVSAGLTLANVAVVLSIIAAVISIAIGLLRLHDRLKYGPGKGYRE